MGKVLVALRVALAGRQTLELTEGAAAAAVAAFTALAALGVPVALLALQPQDTVLGAAAAAAMPLAALVPVDTSKSGNLEHKNEQIRTSH